MHISVYSRLAMYTHVDIVTSIKQILNRTNYRFAPAMKQLQEEFYTYHINQNNQRKKSYDGKSNEEEVLLRFFFNI